eukprot:s2018_g16.t1
MSECLQGDFMTGLLTACATENVKMVLSELCSIFYDLWTMPEALSERERFFSVVDRSPLKSLFTELSQFVSMIGTVFQLDDIPDDVKSVTYFLNYPTSGTSKFARNMRALMSGDLPPDACDEEKAARSLLKRTVQDTIRTASSCEVLRPLVAEAKKSVDVDNPLPEKLLEGCRLLPKLKDGLRTGEAKPFADLLATKVVAYVNNLCSDPGLSSTITTKDLKDLETALDSMNEDDKVLAAEQRLKSFATKHNNMIAKQDLFGWARSFKKAHEDLQGGDVHALDVNAIKSVQTMVQKCGGGTLPDGLPELLRECAFFGVASSEKKVLETILAKLPLVQTLCRTGNDPCKPTVDTICGVVKASVVTKLKCQQWIALGESIENRLKRDSKLLLLKQCMEAHKLYWQEATALESMCYKLAEAGAALSVSEKLYYELNHKVVATLIDECTTELTDTVKMLVSQPTRKLDSAFEGVSNIVGEWLHKSWHDSCEHPDALDSVLEAAANTISKIRVKPLKTAIVELEKEIQGELTQTEEFLAAFTPLSEQSKVPVGEELATLAEAKASKQEGMGKAAVIVTESVIIFCLKVMNNDKESAAEKDKKKSLLVSQWAEVESANQGRSEDLVLPFIKNMAVKLMKAKPETSKAKGTGAASGLDDYGRLGPVKLTEIACPLFLGAFQSADFVLWDSVAGLEVWRHRCGGAKRPNSLVVDSGRSFTFAFSTSKSLEIHSTASPAASGASVPRALRCALHGREIHQICWLRAPGFGGATPGVLATASEDTSLRVLNVSGAMEGGPCTLSPAAAIVRFPGAVRALCSLPLPQPTVPRAGYATTEPTVASALLVSGGAKGALRAHLLQGDAVLLGVWCTSLGQVDPVKMEEAPESSSDSEGEVTSPGAEPGTTASGTAPRLEERVMALSCVEVEMAEAHREVLLACASSSGFLRTWQMQIFPQQGKVEVTFLERFQVFNTTALCMECFTAPKFRGVFVGSAAGTLAALQLQGLRPLCEELQLHQAGVNDLALRLLDGRVAALTAGDDHGVGLCLYALEDDAVRLIGSRLIESAHFSAVRSVAWAADGAGAGSALSLGLERRLRLWRVQLEEQALELKAERIASCTEPESMAAWPLPEGTLVALAGRGVELCSIDASVPG